MVYGVMVTRQILAL